MQKLGSTAVLNQTMLWQNTLCCNISRNFCGLACFNECTRCTAQINLLNHPDKRSPNGLTLPTLTPSATSVRHRTPNLKRPAIPSKARALALEITFEKFKNALEGLPPTETCINAVKESVGVSIKKENPFHQILAREFLAEVEAGPMLAVMHRHPCNEEDLFDMKVQIHRSNMKYLWHGTKVVHLAFKDSKYENLLQAYESDCGTVVCYDTDIQKLLKLERRLPYLTLMCAVVDGRIMSLQQLRYAAALPPLPLMRATLLQTLGTQAQRLSQHLTHHQTELTGALARYCEEKSDSREHLTSPAPDVGSSSTPAS